MPIGPQTIEEYASAVLKKTRTLNKGWLRRHWFDIALLLIFSASWGLYRYFARQSLLTENRYRLSFPLDRRCGRSGLLAQVM
jgi:hypothetical protein